MTIPDEVGVESIRATLAAGISAADTSFTVESASDAALFPTLSFQVKIDNEVILVGSRSGVTFSGLTRGQERTAAMPHPARQGVAYVLGGEMIESGLSSGGSQPITREQLGGNNVTIANGAGAPLTWDSVFSGTPLLDITVPAAPTIVTSGTYAVTLQIGPQGAMTAAGNYRVKLELDATGEDPTIYDTSAPSNANDAEPQVSLGMTYYIPAGGTIVVTVYNHDGAASVDFAINNAIVQRLS